jgi:hypothetical protein
MKTFKQFLLDEVARSPQRAAKLAKYIANRISKGGNTLYTSSNKAETTNNQEKLDSVVKGDVRTKHMSVVSRINKKNLSNVPSEQIPTSELEVIQHNVNLDGVLHKIAMGAQEPITAVSHKRLEYVVDGHHRYMANKLLGKPATVKVISSKKANEK